MHVFTGRHTTIARTESNTRAVGYLLAIMRGVLHQHYRASGSCSCLGVQLPKRRHLCLRHLSRYSQHIFYSVWVMATFRHVSQFVNIFFTSSILVVVLCMWGGRVMPFHLPSPIQRGLEFLEARFTLPLRDFHGAVDTNCTLQDVRNLSRFAHT